MYYLLRNKAVKNTQDYLKQQVYYYADIFYITQ